MVLPGMDSVSTSKLGPRSWLYVALLVLAVGAVYAQCVHFAPLYVWDDRLYLLDNPASRNWMGATWTQRLLTPALGYPVPVPTLLYFFAHQLPSAALVPAAHGLNVAVHLLGVVAAFLLARRWLESERFALMAAAIWGLHPLLAESVAWLTNLKGVLLGLFTLTALIVWERHLERPTLGRALLVVALFVLALGSRPGAAALPGVMALRLWMNPRRSTRNPRFWIPIACCVALIAIYVPIALIDQHHLVGPANTAFDPYQISIFERLQRIAAALWVELSHVVVPVGLQPMYYPSPNVMTARAIGGTVLGALMVGATIWAWWNDRRVFGGLALFWAFYLPASGIEVLPRFTADTYMYLPLLGLTVAAGAFAQRHLDPRNDARRIWTVVLVVTALLLGLLSFVQAARWRDPVALLDPVIAEVPLAPRSYEMIAKWYLRRGQPKRAAQYYRRGLTPLYEHGMISRNVLRAFEQSGEPGRAADLALRLYSPKYPGEPPDGLPVYLTWLLVRYDLPLPKQPSARTIIRRDALEALPDLARRWPKDFLERVSTYFARQNERQVAARYRQAAADKD